MSALMSSLLQIEKGFDNCLSVLQQDVKQHKLSGESRVIFCPWNLSKNSTDSIPLLGICKPIVCNVLLKRSSKVFLKAILKTRETLGDCGDCLEGHWGQKRQKHTYMAWCSQLHQSFEKEDLLLGIRDQWRGIVNPARHYLTPLSQNSRAEVEKWISRIHLWEVWSHSHTRCCTNGLCYIWALQVQAWRHPIQLQGSVFSCCCPFWRPFGQEIHQEKL